MAYYKSMTKRDKEKVFLEQLPWDPQPNWTHEVDEEHPNEYSWAPPGFDWLKDFQLYIHEPRDVVASVRHKKKPSDDPNAPPVRGMTTGKGSTSQVGKGGKILLDYNENAKGPKDKSVNSMAVLNIGATIRNKVHMKAPTFIQLPPEEMYRVIVGLKEHFYWDADNMPLRRCVLKEATDKYSHFNSECSKYWKELPSPEYARSVIPINFANGRNTSWDWLCQHFESDEFKIRSRANTSNRGNLPFLHRGGPHPIAYKYLEELQKDDPFPMFNSYKEKMVAGATEGPSFDFHCRCVEEADRRVTVYTNLHPKAEIADAKREVGKNEGDIVAYVRSQEPNPLRGNDLRFCGRLGQPSLSQASAAETGLSSRSRSGGRHRSSRSSSTCGAESSVPSPTPYQLGLEKMIVKQNKMIWSQRGKINKQGYILKKLLGLMMCGGGQNTGTTRQEEIDNMVAELDSPENEDEDEVSEEEDETSIPISRCLP